LWAGRAIPNPAAWGLDFAFPATFIGMLIPLIVSRSIAACVISAGIAAILFNGLPHQLGLIVAAICGIVAGVVVERWFPPRAEPTNHQPLHVAVEPRHARTNEP
jgi:predicted branched-subunit amino acid permease